MNFIISQLYAYYIKINFFKKFQQFNKSIYIPASLTHLITGKNFDEKIINLHQSNLTHLTLGAHHNQHLDFPTSIKYLNINSPMINFKLPNNIEILEFDTYFDSKIDELPQLVKTIKFGKHCRFNKELDFLPEHLEYLELNPIYDKKILNIPQKLKKITLSDDYEFIEQHKCKNHHLETYKKI